MDKKITALELSSLSSYLYKAFFTIGGFQLLLGITSLDTTISLLIGTILGIIILFIYINLNNYLENETIYEKINNTFPKYISFIINIILILITYLIILYTLFNISKFIKYILLPNINILPISILFLSVSCFVSYKGITTICRSSLLSLYIYIIIFLITILCLFIYPNIMNLLPFTIIDTTLIFNNSLNYLLISNTLLLFLLIIPKNRIIDQNKQTKYISRTYLIMNLYMIIRILLLISILGIKVSKIYIYPEITMLKKINIFNFIERLESFSAYLMLFDNFFLISLLIFYLDKGVNIVFKLNTNKKLLYIILLIFIIIPCNYLRLENIYPIKIALIIFIIIHLILLLFKKN